MQDVADPTVPPLWRRLARHATTLLLIAVTCAIVAPTVATVLLAVQANGLSFQAAYALALAPWAIVIAGPGVFLLGLVFGWMLLVLSAEGYNTLPARIALAVLIASIAWWLSDPLPGAPSAAAPAAGWPIWAASAASAALIFTRFWVAHRLRHPIPLPPEE